MKTTLDTCITKCPTCGTFYAEASWYALTLSSDLECSKCGTSFNAEENLRDRLLIDFSLDKDGKVVKVERAGIPKA